MSVLTQIEAAMSLTGAARYEQAARVLLQNEWEIMNTRMELMAIRLGKFKGFFMAA